MKINYEINGKKVSKDEFKETIKDKQINLEQAPMINAAYSLANPLVSQALGCHRTQVKEFNQDLADHGITGARYNDNGDCEIFDKNARNQILTRRNMRDNDAGYGDHSGK